MSLYVFNAVCTCRLYLYRLFGTAVTLLYYSCTTYYVVTIIMDRVGIPLPAYVECGTDYLQVIQLALVTRDPVQL